MLAGLAFAHGFGLEQTRRVAVACISANLSSRHAAPSAELEVATSSATTGTTGRPSTAIAHHRGKLCGSGKPTSLRGLSRRRAVLHPPEVPLSAGSETAAVAAGTATAVGGSPTPPADAPSPDEPKVPTGDGTPPETSIAGGPPASTSATT